MLPSSPGAVNESSTASIAVNRPARSVTVPGGTVSSDGVSMRTTFEISDQFSASSRVRSAT